MAETILTIRLPPNEYKAIQNHIKSGDVMNASDFVRKAVSEKLERMKVKSQWQSESEQRD